MVQIVYDEIRENILGVAQGIFSRFGFKKTTMEDIYMSKYNLNSFSISRTRERF